MKCEKRIEGEGEMITSKLCFSYSVHYVSPNATGSAKTDHIVKNVH